MSARAPLRPRPDPSLPWPIPLAGVELIADYEGLRLHAYRCPSGTPTIGWGQTEDVSLDMVWTKAQADADLCRSLVARTAAVRDACTRPPSPNELAALVSLSYNIGQAAFARSTALARHNAGDALSAARAFGLFNKARVDGKLVELPGLTARRAAESALYLRPDDDTPDRMPQVVAPSSTLAASPIAQSGALVSVVGAASIVGQVGDHLRDLGSLAAQARTVVVDALGFPAGTVGPALLVLLGGVVIWQRIRQRRRGWA